MMAHPVGNAGGKIQAWWTIEHFAEVLTSLPPIVRDSDVQVPELLLSEDARLRVYYCPFDYINLDARIVIVGITPGLKQALLSNKAAQSALRSGKTLEEALHTANRIGSFAGPMRHNLVSMLDGIGVHRYLGIQTTAMLFSSEINLVHTTSAIVYPTFRKRRDGSLDNYRGSPSPSEHPLLQDFTSRVLVGELELLPDAKIVPLGKAVSGILLAEANRGRLDSNRCLLKLPHPAGSNNGRRLLEFPIVQTELAEQVASWS